MVDEAGRLLRRGPNGVVAVDEVPRLGRRDLEVVLAADDRCGDSSRRMGGVGLHTVGHQIPAGHPLEDLATVGVFSHRTDHQGIRPEAPQMPSDIERRAAQYTTPVDEVVEENLAENDRAIVETVHGFLPDAFLRAGGFGPR